MNPSSPYFFSAPALATALLSTLGVALIAPSQSEAAPLAPDFGPSSRVVCPQLCIPVGNNPCANPCLEKAKAEEILRKTSEFVQPSHVSFPSHVAAGSPLSVAVTIPTNSVCTELNSHLSHALVDPGARQIRVRVAAGQKAEFCNELFVERELKTEFALSLKEKGLYEVITETAAGSSQEPNQLPRGFIEAQ